jgi:hypothetical protein
MIRSEKTSSGHCYKNFKIRYKPVQIVCYVGSHMTYEVYTELYKHRWVGNTWPVIVPKLCIKTSNVSIALF